jgi:hypothetical protein
VYSTVADEVALVLRVGHSVVVDAVYARAAGMSLKESLPLHQCRASGCGWKAPNPS